MSAKMLNELVEKARLLSPEERLHLISIIAESTRSACPSAPRHRQWREICGVAPAPLLGEDAQEWVTRTRREGDERRRLWQETPP